MIPRYSLPEISALFTDEARFGAWLEVEVLAVEAWAPRRRSRRRRARCASAPVSTSPRSTSAKITDHDVAAFVDVVQEQVGPPAGAWVHYGLTSSDVVDTALALQMTRAVDLLSSAAAQLENAIAKRAREFRDTPMVGRTHGIHAEPTTFGAKLALWALQVRRDRERLVRARATIAVGKLSGGGHVLERRPRGRALRVRATRPAAGPRDPGAAARPPRRGHVHVRVDRGDRRVVRARDPAPAAHRGPRSRGGFREGEQKGSSAMPHKRNPIKSEQMCGLARVLRANLQAALEDVALWHERDISHSSVERIIVPDSLMLAYYVLVKFRQVVEGLRVYPERMMRNLDASFGLVFSQPVLLALVEAGRTRDEAYRMVQRNAMRAWQEERSFRELLGADPEVTATLDAARLDACFDLKRSLANINRVFDALDDMGELPA